MNILQDFITGMFSFYRFKSSSSAKNKFQIGYLKAGYMNGKMLYSIRMGFPLMLTNFFKWCLRFPYFFWRVFIFWLFKVYVIFEKKIVSKELGLFIRKYRYKK